MDSESGTCGTEEGLQEAPTYPKVPCRRVNTPKCPSFKYGYPDTNKGVPSAARTCQYLKDYVCPYLKHKLKEKKEMSEDDKPEEEETSPEEETPEETTEEKPIETIDHSAELADITAQLASVKAELEAQKLAKFESLLLEAKALTPDIEVDKLIENFTSTDAKIVFLSSFMAEMKKLGYPKKEDPVELTVDEDTQKKMEAELTMELFGKTPEQMEEI